MAPSVTLLPAINGSTVLARIIPSPVNDAARSSEMETTWITVGPPWPAGAQSLPPSCLQRVSSDGTSALMRAPMNSGSTAPGARLEAPRAVAPAPPLADKAAGTTFSTMLTAALSAVSVMM